MYYTSVGDRLASLQTRAYVSLHVVHGLQTMGHLVGTSQLLFHNPIFS